MSTVEFDDTGEYKKMMPIALVVTDPLVNIYNYRHFSKSLDS